MKEAVEEEWEEEEEEEENEWQDGERHTVRLNHPQSQQNTHTHKKVYCGKV